MQPTAITSIKSSKQSTAINCAICGRGFVSLELTKNKRIRAVLQALQTHCQERHRNDMLQMSNKIAVLVANIISQWFLITELGVIPDTENDPLNFKAKELEEYTNETEKDMLKYLGLIDESDISDESIETVSVEENDENAKLAPEENKKLDSFGLTD